MVTTGMTNIEQHTMDSIISACNKYSRNNETLRDKFAIAAISNPSFFDMVCSRGQGYNKEHVAECAYELADAMMGKR